MKGGSVCSNSTIEADNGKTKFQAYTYSAASVAGMDCGFFIQVNKLPGSKPVTSPSDGKPRNDIFVNISGSGKEAKATDFNVQDMFIGGSAASEVSSYRDASDNKIDSVLQGKIAIGGPIEVIDKVLEGKENYQIIIFDSDGNKEYLERGHPYNENNKKEPKNEEEPASAPEPVDETPEAPESAPVERKYYHLTALVGTDKVGSVDVLKLKKDEVNLAPAGESPQFTPEDPVINKDNFSKIVCEQMKSTLKGSPAVEKQFNISESLVKAENMETDVNREREEASEANLEKAMGELKGLIGELETKDKYLGISENFRDFAGSIDHYKSLKGIGKYNVLGSMEPGMANAINKKYGVPDEELQYGMDDEKRYNFYLAVSNNLKKLVNLLNHVAKPITKSEGGELEIEMNRIIEGDTMNSKYNRPYKMDYFTFHKKIIPYEFTASKIPVFKQSSNYTGVRDYLGQKSRKFSSSVRKRYNNMNIGNSTRKLYKGTTNALSSGLKSFEGAVKNSPLFRSKKTEPDQMGGKRKTRKIKARKTRRNVQRKRRQSKKH